MDKKIEYIDWDKVNIPITSSYPIEMVECKDCKIPQLMSSDKLQEICDKCPTRKLNEWRR